MKEDFVTYKLAVKLKEKGFEWDKITTYNPRTKVRNNHIEPTISQALKWLRKKHAINIEIGLWYKGWYCDVWSYEYYEEENEYSIKKEFQSSDYTSYEQATIAGIEYVLENLI